MSAIKANAICLALVYAADLLVTSYRIPALLSDSAWVLSGCMLLKLGLQFNVSYFLHPTLDGLSRTDECPLHQQLEDLIKVNTKLAAFTLEI